MFSGNEVIAIAIQLEKNGERFYRSGAEQVSEGGLRELLKWLADEEVRHRERFLEMKEQCPGGDEGLAEQVGGAILQGALSDHALSLDEVDCSKIVSVHDLVDIAIVFEKDGIAFYELLQAFIDDPNTLGTVKGIINEEKNHVELLTEKKNALMGPAGPESGNQE